MYYIYSARLRNMTHPDIYRNAMHLTLKQHKKRGLHYNENNHEESVLQCLVVTNHQYIIDQLLADASIKDTGMVGNLITIAIEQKNFTKAMDLLQQYPQELWRVDFADVAHAIVASGSSADLTRYMQLLGELGNVIEMRENIYLLSLLWAQKNFITASQLIDQLLPAYIQPLTLCIHQWEQGTLPTPTALSDALAQWNMGIGDFAY